MAGATTSHRRASRSPRSGRRPRRPRPRGRSVLTRTTVLIVGLVGLAITVGLLSLIRFGTVRYGDVEVGVSIAFTAFALCLIVAALECRSETGTISTTATSESRQTNRAARRTTAGRADAGRQGAAGPAVAVGPRAGVAARGPGGRAAPHHAARAPQGIGPAHVYPTLDAAVGAYRRHTGADWTPVVGEEAE